MATVSDANAGSRPELHEVSHHWGSLERPCPEELYPGERYLSEHHVRHLGVASGAEIHQVVLQASGAYRGWVVWLWGISTDDPAVGPYNARRYSRLVISTNDELWVRAVRIEVRRCSGTYGDDYSDESPSVIVEWADAGLSPGRVSVCGLPFPGNKLPDLEGALADPRPAFEILASVGKGGRPAGKSPPDPGFSDRFNRALLKRYDDGFTDRPSQAVVAAEMGESEDTLQRRIKGRIVSWPPSWPPK